MASCEPSFPSGNRSPQPNSSGDPLEVRADEAAPGPPGPKRKRERSADAGPEEEAAPGAQDAWAVETLCGLKMKLKRQRACPVLPEHHAAFARLLEDPVVKRFLAWDKNLRVSDKYLLSMVVAYFSRAGLFSWQYQRIHFFLALYLANDMEEDSQAPKRAIFSFLYGRDRSPRALFHRLRFQLFRSMGWRMRVSREECEQIQAFDPELWVWGRDRALLSQAPGPQIAEPRGDSRIQQEVNPDANGRSEEGKEDPPVQII
ncbi:PREDICTED: speedy protein E4-like [Miniopterus natalensis]|uniref:speedy protein E4-like n=1 Tax=Miniopterus natalensis TaxID=291302 RepID=UPI0007A72BE3|nr:PREDICTED: speedy protein E4-like [Miniopterus natalensis]